MSLANDQKCLHITDKNYCEVVYINLSERAVVTFIDILGFKNLVAHKSNSEMVEILSLFHQKTSVISFFPSNISPQVVDNLIKIKTVFFSDSVVRIRYVPEWEARNPSDGHLMCILEKELVILAEIQASLLKKGILIRGGITIGEIYYNEETHQLFGKAMNRAYELESTLANYPRIVIDPTFSNIYSRSIEFIESPITIDSEMLFSVDYFNEREAKLLLWDMERWPEKRKEILQQIEHSVVSQKRLLEDQRKALVKLLLQSTSGMRIDQANSPSDHLFRFQDIKVFGKYAWTVNRFNAAIESWEKVKAEIGDSDTFVNRIFLRDFEWTDPNVLMDENSFSRLSSEYSFENI